jgi:PST family polysaccharide transporter
LSATREISIHRDNKEKVNEIFSSVMIIKFGLLLLSFIIMSIIIFSFDKFRQDWLIYYLTFGMVIGQVLFPVWFFQGMERMKYITILNILAKLIFTVAIFIFVREVSDYIYVPLLNAVGFIVAGIMALWIVFKDFGIKFVKPNMNTLKMQLKEGWHIFISTVAISLYRNFNVFILGLYTHNIIVGYYSIAERILMAIQSLQVVMGQALFPYFSYKFRYLNLYESIKFMLKYFKVILLFYLILFIITYIFSEKLVFFVSGKIFLTTILDLKIMAIVIIIGGLNYYFGILGLVNLGLSDIFSKIVLIAGLLHIILATILSMLFKDVGTSISLVISESILLVLISRYILRILNKK